jgi:hypothetical protein
MSSFISLVAVMVLLLSFTRDTLFRLAKHNKRLHNVTHLITTFSLFENLIHNLGGWWVEAFQYRFWKHLFKFQDVKVPFMKATGLRVNIKETGNRKEIRYRIHAQGHLSIAWKGTRCVHGCH